MTDGLNWKGRAIDWAMRVGDRMTPPRIHPVRWLDDRLGIGHIHGLGLNWKGRAIERFWLIRDILTPSLGHPVRWLDDRLGIGHIHSSGLNWKGRMIERSSALAGHPVLWLDDRLGLSHMHSSGLNWKGRVIERSGALRHKARLRRRLLPLVSVFINSAAFSMYWALAKVRPRRTTVRSVLQISILSHKPYMLSRAMRLEGLKSDCFMLNVGMGEGILNVGWDFAMPAGLSPWKRWLLEHYYLWAVLARYDVIHSHFKTFLSHNGWELPYLKRLGKVLVFHSRGCDVRHRSLNMRLQPVLNCCQECEYPVGSCDTDYQRQQVGIMRKYGDLFFVTTPDLRDFVLGSEHVPFIHPMGVNFESIVAVPRDPAVFRVVTSSNHHGIDGTRFIRAAVGRLQREGRAIELIEVSQMPYREALAVYKSADVYVGKLRMGYYNNANIETMMLGVPNMSYIREDFRSIAPDCPIIITTPDTVYDQLHHYIDRRDDLRAIGARGPAFVRAHHDPQQIVKLMIARYNEALAGRGPRSVQDDEPRTVPLVRSDLTPVVPPRSS